MPLQLRLTNPLAALIAPLAALALLGAATAVAVNPVLLQIAVINNGKRRKKREATDDVENLDPNSIRQLEEIQKLENL